MAISDEELKFLDTWNVVKPPSVEVAGTVFKSAWAVHTRYKRVWVEGSWHVSYQNLPFLKLVEFKGSLEDFRRDIVMMKLAF